MNKNQSNSLFYKLFYFSHYFILVFAIISCSPTKKLNLKNYSVRPGYGKPDYSNLTYWASHPWKKDAADNIPATIKNKVIDSVADVFFVYPTTYTDVNMPMGWNAEIDNKALNKKTAQTTILYQASVFNEMCRIFAPHYRQANIKAFYTPDKKEADKAFELAYTDVKSALEYYLKYYNHGRPIINASHSQGTLHALRLLKEFFEDNPPPKKIGMCLHNRPTGFYKFF